MDILESRRQTQRLSDSLLLPQSTEFFQSAGRSTQKNTTTLNTILAAQPQAQSEDVPPSPPGAAFLAEDRTTVLYVNAPLNKCLPQPRGDSQASSFLWVSAMSPSEDLNTISELSHCFYSRHSSTCQHLWSRSIHNYGAKQGWKFFLIDGLLGAKCWKRITETQWSNSFQMPYN